MPMDRLNKNTDQVSDKMIKKHRMAEQLQMMARTDWSGIMMICIYGLAENRIYGEIINRCLQDPIPFCGLDQLLLKIDEVCELVGTPMLSMNPRFLQNEEKAYYAGIAEKHKQCVQEQNGWKNMSDILKKQVSLTMETLEIQILFRNNATMQGRLCCSLSRKKHVSFRSALELLRMLKEVENKIVEKKSAGNAVSELEKMQGEKRGKAI